MDPSTFILIAGHGNLDEAREALRVAPDLASVRSDRGVSVLASTVYAGRLSFAREIARRRDDLDLFEAACLGDCERVRTLLDSEPEMIDRPAPDGFTALGFAAFFGHEELLEDLLARGADLEKPAHNTMRVRPIHSAAAHADPALATRMVGRLLAAGADPNAQQQGGETPLHEAVFNENLELIDVLLAAHANPHLSNDEGDSPLQNAQARGLDAVVAKLLPNKP